MIERAAFALFLALIWGVIYALWLQTTRRGKTLAARLTWISVVLGVGVDWLISALILEAHIWLLLFAVFALSGLPIVIRSVNNEIDLIHAMAKHGPTDPDSE